MSKEEEQRPMAPGNRAKYSTGNATEPDDKYTKEVDSLRSCMRLYFFHPNKPKTFGYVIAISLQFTKLCFITAMLVKFGHERSNFTDIVNRGHLTIRNLMMKNWDAGWETVPYPPAHGDFAVYTKDDILDRINYAVAMYYNVEKDAIGWFSRPNNASLRISLKYFDDLDYNSRLPDGLNIKETLLTPDRGLHIDNASGMYTYDVAAEFKSQNISQPIKRLLHLSLDFTLNSVRVFHKQKTALCLDISGKLTFSDLENNGQVIEDLNTLTKKVKCATISVDVRDWDFNEAKPLGLVITVLVSCGLSLLSTGCIFVFAVCVCRKTKCFMKKHYGTFYKPMNAEEKDLPWRQYLKFFTFWDIFSVSADIIMLIGTAQVYRGFLTGKEEVKLDTTTLDGVTVLLGIGCILSWLSLLRYSHCSNKFNVLFATICRASFDVLAYLICVGVLFTGFCVGGYVVLGPYHIKFKTPEESMNTLLSILNGDEIFATLAILDVSGSKNPKILWFARVYIWIYVIVFTIVVLNLLVAILVSTYEVIKVEYKTKEDDRDLGPLEIAIRDLVKNKTQSPLRQSLVDIIGNNDRLSEEESSIRTELRRFLRTNEDTGDIVTTPPRTIKAFMNQPPLNNREGTVRNLIKNRGYTEFNDEPSTNR